MDVNSVSSFCILILGVFVFSCNSNKRISEESIPGNEYIDSSMIGTTKYSTHRTFLRENCELNQYSCCSDGTDNIARVYPLLTPYNENSNVIYNDTIYAIPSLMLFEQIRNSGINAQLPNFIDSTLQSLCDSNNLVGFEEKRFSKMVQKSIRKSGTSLNFDGKLYYNKLAITINYIYGGKRTFLLPTINNDKNTVWHQKQLPVCYITMINK